MKKFCEFAENRNEEDYNSVVDQICYNMLVTNTQLDENFYNKIKNVLLHENYNTELQLAQKLLEKFDPKAFVSPDSYNAGGFLTNRGKGQKDVLRYRDTERLDRPDDWENRGEKSEFPRGPVPQSTQGIGDQTRISNARQASQFLGQEEEKGRETKAAVQKDWGAIKQGFVAALDRVGETLPNLSAPGAKVVDMLSRGLQKKINNVNLDKYSWGGGAPRSKSRAATVTSGLQQQGGPERDEQGNIIPSHGQSPREKLDARQKPGMLQRMGNWFSGK